LNRETYILLHSTDFATRELTPLLTGFLESGIPDEQHAPEAILGLCLAYADAPIRNLAKDVIKKHGSKPIKAALKAKSRRNYLGDAGKETMVADLEELSQIEGFAVHQFARVLSFKLGYTPLVGARALKTKVLHFFYDRASDEEIRDYFRCDGYDPKRKEHALLGVGAISDHVAELLWEAAGQMREEVTGIFIETPGDAQLPPDLGIFPKLSTLHIDAAGLTELPEAFLAQPELSRLTLKNCAIARLPDSIGTGRTLGFLYLWGLKNLKELPAALGDLPNLYRLEVHNSPIAEIPGSLGSCPKLKEIVVSDCALRRIPDGIGRSTSLKQVDVFYVTAPKVPLEYVDPSVFELAMSSEGYKDKLRALMAPAGSYQPVYKSLQMFIESFADKPAATKAIAAFKRDGNAAAAHIPELILATSRCYLDDEHGPSSNAWYSRVIDKEAPDLLKAANAKIARIGFIDAQSDAGYVTSMFNALQNLDGFDVARFAEFVHEMTGHPTATKFL
jgi:hypothetical protein